MERIVVAAEIMLDIGSYEKAYYSLKNIERGPACSSRCKVLLGQAYMGKQNYSELLTSGKYVDAIAICKEVRNIIIVSSYCLIAPLKAIVIAKDSCVPKAQLCIASAHRLQGQLDLAVDSFKKAYECNSLDEELLFVYGSLLLEKGMTTEVSSVILGDPATMTRRIELFAEKYSKVRYLLAKLHYQLNLLLDAQFWLETIPEALRDKDAKLFSEEINMKLGTTTTSAPNAEASKKSSQTFVEVGIDGVELK